MYNENDLFEKFVSLNGKQISVNNRLFNVSTSECTVLLNSGKSSAKYGKSELHKRWTIKKNKLHYFVNNTVTNNIEKVICAELQ